MRDKKKLTQLEIDNIIDETINLSILVKLKELNIITDKQFYVLKKKNKGILLINTTEVTKNLV